MELASMLAEEPFSDHPASACPVIGAFLRVYNDAVDDERRQDLYRYASIVVDSRAGEDVTAARAARLAERAREMRRARRRWPLGVGILVGFWCTPGFTPDASFAVSELIQRGREGHSAALALVDELLEMGTDTRDHSAAEVAGVSPWAPGAAPGPAEAGAPARVP